MITNHSYLDNPTFRGMRQSLMNTFNEIYILDLHGNSLKKETNAPGRKGRKCFRHQAGGGDSIVCQTKKRKKMQSFSYRFVRPARNQIRLAG